MIGYIAQMSMPEASTPSAMRRVAVDHDLRHRHLVGRNRVLEVEVRLGPREARFQQAHVGGDDLGVLLAEDALDLLARELQVEAVDAAEHAEHEHVLALARVRHERAAFALERNFVDLEAIRVQRRDGVDVRLRDLRILVFAPHALEQDGGALLELAGAHAAEQHLLVERHRRGPSRRRRWSRAQRRCECGCPTHRRRCARAAGSPRG